MLVSHSEKGYSCHCFRCSEPESHKFIPHGTRSIAEIQRHKKELSETKGKPPYLPGDFTLDIPVQYAWFLKYGISMHYARKFQLGYSEFFHRIIIPIFNCGRLQAVHMRAINPDDKPKYLNLGKPEPDLLFWANGTDTKDLIIIVEDVLSAIKINLSGYNAVALNGSSITDVQALRLTSTTGKRIVWLDNDDAGLKGRRQVVTQLKLQGTKSVYYISSHQDPKTYNKEEIAQHIEGAIKC